MSSDFSNEAFKKVVTDSKWTIVNGLRREVEKKARALVDYSGSVDDVYLNSVINDLRSLLITIDDILGIK